MTRAICGMCGRDVSVLAEGRLRLHANGNGEPCRGGHRPTDASHIAAGAPEDMLREMRDVRFRREHTPFVRVSNGDFAYEFLGALADTLSRIPGGPEAWARALKVVNR